MKSTTQDEPVFLCRDVELLSLPLSPPERERLPLPAASAAQPIVRAWNRLGGLLGAVSKRLPLDAALALAILCVESSGSGFGPGGRLKIRFEVHLFGRELQSAGTPAARDFAAHFAHDREEPWRGHRFRATEHEPWRAVHRSQSGEWEALEFARRWCVPAALRSISMGAPQILGANHAIAGYRTPEALFEAFCSSENGERLQVLALFDFLCFARPGRELLTRLQQSDLVGFARLYNGPGQAQQYAQRIAAQLRLWSKLQR